MKWAMILTLCAGLAISASAEDYSRFAKVETISCDFRMERHLAIAAKPLVSNGHFYYRRPGFLRWEYLQPSQHGFLINGDKAFAWQIDGGKKNVKDISRQPVARIMAEQLQIFISMDMEKISRYYQLQPIDNGLDLLPLNEQETQQQVERIRLIFDPQQPTVRQTIIMEKSGEKTVITYSSNRLDQPLPNEVFTP